MNRKWLLLLLLFSYPVCCFADGMEAVGEAFAQLALMVLVIIALLNVAAFIMSFRPPSFGRTFLIVLALLTCLVAVFVSTLGINQELAAMREERAWTTEIPKIEAERQRMLSMMREDIAAGGAVLLAALGLSYWYIRCLFIKRRQAGDVAIDRES